MRIVSAALILADGDSTRVPTAGPIYNGWGELGRTKIVGPDRKAAPARLNATWFSYIERKYYTGSWALPTDTIATLMSAGFNAPVTNKPSTYRRFIVGMAPGGHVSTWLAGSGLVKEISAGTAEEADIDAFDHLYASREAFIRRQLQNFMSDAEIESAMHKSPPPGLWERSRTRYAWQPIVGGTAHHTYMWIRYHNGEREFFRTDEPHQPDFQKRAVPKEVSLTWADGNGDGVNTKLALDEEETFAAFAKIAAASPPNQLRLYLEVLPDGTATAAVRNDTIILPLHKTHLVE